MTDMKALGRAVAVVFVYLGTCFAWLVLGTVMSYRTDQQKGELEARVADLWGRPQVQRAPSFELASDAEAVPTVAPRSDSSTASGPYPPTTRAGTPIAAATTPPTASLGTPLQPSSTNIDVALDLDQRLKGLTWYSLYDVGFHGRWTYVHERAEADELVVRFAFPDREGVYDGFTFLVNGEPASAEPTAGVVVVRVPVLPGDAVAIDIAYQSRGLDSWRYAPANGAASLKDFHLVMHTNFDAIDFPPMTLSPSSRDEGEQGPVLSWDFEQVVSGNAIGMQMPQRIQPGQLASSLSYSAPISLLFFFLVIAVLARLRAIEIHPVNYFFLGAAFFSFHLLFAYSVDHISIWVAFTLASLVSVAMVVLYLRLVVSGRFAVVHAGTAQLVYLVGFSLAHFASGFTGLTVTVLSVATVFLLMLLTGRVRWGEVLGRLSSERAVPAPVYPPPHFVATYPSVDVDPSAAARG
jgi:hypothetical protein